MADAGTSETGISEATPVVTPYERIGGAVVVDRLVEIFYHRMDTLPEAKQIRDMHGTNLGPIKHILKRYLSEWLGGPKLYSPEKGHPRLRQRHLGFPMSSAMPGCSACAARWRRR